MPVALWWVLGATGATGAATAAWKWMTGEHEEEMAEIAANERTEMALGTRVAVVGVVSLAVLAAIIAMKKRKNRSA